MQVFENDQRRGAAAGRMEGRLGSAVGRHRVPAGSGAFRSTGRGYDERTLPNRRRRVPFSS